MLFKSLKFSRTCAIMPVAIHKPTKRIKKVLSRRSINAHGASWCCICGIHIPQKTLWHCGYHFAVSGNQTHGKGRQQPTVGRSCHSSQYRKARRHSRRESATLSSAKLGLPHDMPARNSLEAPSEHLSASSRCHTSWHQDVLARKTRYHTSHQTPVLDGTPACAPHPANGVRKDQQQWPSQEGELPQTLNLFVGRARVLGATSPRCCRTQPK